MQPIQWLSLWWDPPQGGELQAGESRLAGHNAICPLVGYLIILVSVKPGQARRTRRVGV